MDMLKLSHVSKAFGKSQIINDLSFSVPEHTILGLIGQNGAGKTTTMKMILGLLKADKGDITVNGEAAVYGQNKTNRYIGYLPDVPAFYEYMTPLEYLALCGTITGMPSRKISAKSEELLALVGLEHANKRIRGFSRGMKQRLGIAQALLNEPKLLICDEPTSALDPLGREEILNILSSAKAHTTVVFSTHILSDMERICDSFAFLHQGSIALQGTMEELKQKNRTAGFEIEFLRPEDADFFAAHFPAGQRLNALKLCYEEKSETKMQAALRFLSGNDMPIRHIAQLEPGLENLFMEVVRR